ncbi:hypothetical protein [Pollutibacter soli]|uniref:hypothetical protein n=1 Tax=Pollutibacter soli TaxID=3034157 RepID=UPI0030138B97
MTRYFDSPLKVTGILLTFAGFISAFISLHPSLPESYMISLVGVLVFLTADALTHTSLTFKWRRFFEVGLIVIIVVSTILLTMDFYGMITLRHFQR